MLASLSSGHDDLQDWLLLLAAIIFAVDFVLGFAVTKRVDTDGHGVRHLTFSYRLISLGLALLAFGLFVI